MRGIRIALSLVIAISQFSLLANSNDAHAVSPNGLVISYVIAGESNSASSELIAVHNNNSSDMDITGYCVASASAGQIACINGDANTRVYVRSHKDLTISSAIFATSHSYIPDTTYATGNKLLVGGDTVSLTDGSSIIDSVSWVSGGLPTNNTLRRSETSPGSSIMVDTDLPTDFTLAASVVYPANNSYDVVTVVDVCPNIPDVQQVMPPNYLADAQGDCQPDSCLNIPGLQVNVPDGYDADNAGNCVEHDECMNLAGVQNEVPKGMVIDESDNCVWDIAPIVITEILPNAVGDDTGNEFIELYNPTDRMVDLSLYSISVGASSPKIYTFPIGALLAPGEYRAFRNSEIKFTLLNTSSRVALYAIDGSVVGDTGLYDSPADGESWAFIGGYWQYTNQVTPGSANHSSVVSNEDTTDTVAAACPAGKYRNPLTNRCRNSEADAAVLAACDSDQYRNPDTGRCKKISVTTLTPCKDDQYRSEETNRCRNITTASTQKPCKDNQYRSEETNRCRNLPASAVPAAAFAVQPIKDLASSFVGWWTLGLIGAAAVGYGVWEWRDKLLLLWQRSIRHLRR